MYILDDVDQECLLISYFAAGAGIPEEFESSKPV
jgi:hypothetical protein